MTKHTETRYFVHSYPSTVAGIVAAGAAIALLTRDGIQNGLTLEHGLMPVLVGLTVLFGHEAFRALKEWKVISAVLMLCLAAFGSLIIVGETMGRRAETRDAKIAQATKTVDQYAIIAADYQRAAGLVAQSEQWTAAECASGKGKKCEGQTFTLNQRKAHAEKLKAELEKATAPAPVDSKADKIAYWASVFGASKAFAKELFQNFDPFSLSLFLEMGALIGFGFGIKTRSVPVFESVPAETPKALSFERPLTDDEVEQIRRILTGQKRPLTNDEVAAAAGISKSEASKRVQRAVNAGIVQKLKEGRYNQIALV
jgi:uncharacterized membrane protein